jgi:phage shock protein A
MSEGLGGVAPLDRLGERIERAAQAIQALREERDRLRLQCRELEKRVRTLEAGGTVVAARGGDAGARRWQTERREVATRIESLLRKLERLETLAGSEVR